MPALLLCCSFIICGNVVFYLPIYSWIKETGVISGDIIRDCTVRSYFFIRGQIIL